MAHTLTTAPCLSGCHRTHHDFDLGFQVCDAPMGRLPLPDGRDLAVSVTRVTEPGQATVTTVAVTVGDGEPLELSPADARRLALALRCGAELTQGAAGSEWAGGRSA